MEEIPEVDSVPEVVDTEESIDVDLEEQPANLDELLLIEEEPPGYVVADYGKTDVFSMYVVIILAVLIAYPISRVVIKTGRGMVSKWSK